MIVVLLGVSLAIISISFLWWQAYVANKPPEVHCHFESFSFPVPLFDECLEFDEKGHWIPSYLMRAYEREVVNHVRSDRLFAKIDRVHFRRDKIHIYFRLAEGVEMQYCPKRRQFSFTEKA